jgi:hypothetical protein
MDRGQVNRKKKRKRIDFELPVIFRTLVIFDDESFPEREVTTDQLLKIHYFESWKSNNAATEAIKISSPIDVTSGNR